MGIMGFNNLSTSCESTYQFHAVFSRDVLRLLKPMMPIANHRDVYLVIGPIRLFFGLPPRDGLRG